jgi:hypothetical protein
MKENALFFYALKMVFDSNWGEELRGWICGKFI